MKGIMQDWPLTVDKVLEHARQQHGNREIITRRVEGEITRTTYAELYTMAKRVSAALKDLASVSATGSPHSAGIPSATWPLGMARWVSARCCTRSIRASIPTRSPGSPTMPKTGC